MSAMSENHWKAADPFVCLHVPFGASKDTIKKQYRKLCLLYHPDKVREAVACLPTHTTAPLESPQPSPLQTQHPDASEAFIAITRAYDQLSSR